MHLQNKLFQSIVFKEQNWISRTEFDFFDVFRFLQGLVIACYTRIRQRQEIW